MQILKDDLVGVRCSVTLDMPSLYAALMVYDIRHNFRCEVIVCFQVLRPDILSIICDDVYYIHSGQRPYIALT